MASLEAKAAQMAQKAALEPLKPSSSTISNKARDIMFIRYYDAVLMIIIFMKLLK